MLKMLSCVNDFFRVCFSCTFESLKLINPLYTTIIMKTSKLTIRKSTITKFENKYSKVENGRTVTITQITFF